MQSADAQVVFPRRSLLGEGSLWDVGDQKLYWVDIVDQKVMCFDPVRQANTEWATGQSVGTVVRTRGGRLLLALRHGVGVLDPSSGELRLLVDPEKDKPGNRFNDGKCDPRGRLWAGTMVENGPQGGAALYCFDETLRPEPKITGVDISNGLAWSLDERTFFFIDTPTGVVRAYGFDAEAAALTGGRVVARFDEGQGSPDGMAIDSEDCLWVCLWGGRRVVRVDPETGQMLFQVNVPANNVTSCAFGGKDLNQLYITTARVGQSPEQLEADPAAGSLFVAQVPARGVAAKRFEGEL